tara:strand:+ start:90 stop:557 length:468 start_codon:yes stop_codon:yes gene_type:complete
MKYKNILPLDYSNTWMEKDKEWVPIGEVPFYDPSLFKKFTDYGWDNSYVVVFLSEQIATDMKEKYAICYADFLIVGKNVCIEDIGILGSTDLNNAEWGLNSNELALKIENYSLLNQYQYLERFYLGVVDKMSILKKKILELRTREWYDNMTITAF